MNKKWDKETYTLSPLFIKVNDLINDINISISKALRFTYKIRVVDVIPVFPEEVVVQHVYCVTETHRHRQIKELPRWKHRTMKRDWWFETTDCSESNNPERRDCWELRQLRLRLYKIDSCTNYTMQWQALTKTTLALSKKKRKKSHKTTFNNSLQEYCNHVSKLISISVFNLWNFLFFSFFPWSKPSIEQYTICLYHSPKK